MLEFLKKLFNYRSEDFFPGVIAETEPSSNVHLFEEGVARANQPKFAVKKLTELRKFLYQFQDGSSSCVAFSMAKIAQILYFLITGRNIKFSPGFYYTQRPNKPNLGMWFQDITALAYLGSCLYDLMPCEGISEDDMNALKVEQYHKDSADAFSIPLNWISLERNGKPDFDLVASTIETTNKPVMIWVSFGPQEFFGTSYPKVLGDNKPWAHSIVAVDAFTNIKDGKQYIKIEDSADKETLYEKYIDRAFFDSRCWLARNPINFKFIKSTVPPYTRTTASMQDILKALGYFPVNQQSTGYWGSITDMAVIEFCKNFGIAFVTGRKMWPELEQKLLTF